MDLTEVRDSILYRLNDAIVSCEEPNKIAKVEILDKAIEIVVEEFKKIIE